MRLALVLSIYILSGAASALAFPPYDMPWLIWGALAPALVAATSGPTRVAFFGGFLFGLTQAALLLPWIIGIFGPMGVGLLIIYSTYFAGAFGLSRILVDSYGKHALLWAVPILWVAVEFFRSEVWWLKFSWFSLGYSQHESLALLQVASVGGVYLISLLIAATNSALAWTLEAPHPRRLPAVGGIGLLVIGLHFAGRSVPDPEPGDFEVVGIEGELQPFSFYLETTRRNVRHGDSAELVVWPEYSLTERPCGVHTQRVRDLVDETGVPVLFGGTREAGGAPPNDFENTLFFVRRDGSVTTQVKSEPIPFFVDGQPARDRIPLESAGGRLGAGICYDMDFTYVSQELVSEGATLLVFPTMDALEWGAMQHRQHVSLAPFRAVEHRRWVVRVASSGISRVVDPYGRVSFTTEVGSQQVFRTSVAHRTDRTFYSRVGYYLPHLLLILALGILTLGRVRYRRSRSASSPSPSAE